MDSKLLRTTLSGPWYLEGNTDITAVGADPYDHWMQHGATEGRLPAANVEDFARKLVAEREGPLRAQIAARETSLRQAHDAALARQREVSIQVERARLQGRDEVEEKLRTLSERERAATEKLLLQQKLASDERDAQRESAAARHQELAIQHHEREEALRAQLAERERQLHQLHADAQERHRTLEGQLAQVRLDARDQVEAQLRTLAERERELRQLHADAQEHQRRLEGQLAQVQLDARDQLEAQLRTLAEREREAAEERLRTLAAQHFNRVKAIGAQLAERDRELRQSQVAAQDTQRNLEGELRAATDRERAATEQLLRQQKAHADRRERQRDSASQEIRALSAQHHERERLLLAAIADKERDLRDFHRESAEQRKDFEARIGQSRIAIQHSVAAQRAAELQQLHALNAQHNREIEQHLLSMVERERIFAGEFAAVNELIATERRLLRDQYVAIVSYVRQVVTDLRRRRFWRRTGLAPLRIDSLWDNSRAPTYSLQDWISLRTTTHGTPGRNSQNAHAITATPATIDNLRVQDDGQVRESLRANFPAQTIDELLAWDGHDFLLCTFLTFLGRKPDLEGFAFYMRQLQVQCDKEAIIRQISESEEGKRFGARPTGLRSLMWRQRWRAIPILGAFFNRSEFNVLHHKLRLILDEIEHDIETLEQGISRHLLQFESTRLPSTTAYINALFKSFNASEYVAVNPDVGAAGINPYEHFMRSGWSENRQWPSRFPMPEAAEPAASTPADEGRNTGTISPAGGNLNQNVSRSTPGTASTGLTQSVARPRWSCVMEPASEVFQGNGPIVTRLMHFIWRSRPDLQRAFDIRESTGQLEFLKWLAFHGIEELALTARIFPRDVLHYLRSLGHGYEDIADQVLEEQASAEGCLQNKANQDSEHALVGDVDGVGANLIGYVFGEFGMGEHVRMLARSLNSLDIPFCLIDQDAGFHGTGDASAAAWVEVEPRFDTNIFLVNADVFPFLPFRLGNDFASRRYNVAYWAWELSQWPAEFQLALDMVDEIWAISDFVAESVRSRTRVPVVPMHVVVTAPDLGPGYTKSRYGIPEGSFVFYFIFDAASHLDRKNPIAIVKAFEEAFPDGDARVHLLLKTMNVETAGPLWDQLLGEVSGNPRITILSQLMSREDVLGLNLACDAFVSLHRSEGFGRCVAEAMAYGKPAIVTNYSGTGISPRQTLPASSTTG